MSNLGAADVDSRLEEQLIDGILYAFQEQTNEVKCAFLPQLLLSFAHCIPFFVTASLCSCGSISVSQDVVMLNGFGLVVNALGARVKPYLPQICGTILWRLNNKAAKVRQQAADLISRIANVMHTCGEVCCGREREKESKGS